MRKRAAGVWIGTTTLGVAGLLAATGMAGPEQIVFPKDYATWEKYAIVDRYDNKQYRELYTSPAAVQAVREGKPIPDGTVIAMAIHSALDSRTTRKAVVLPRRPMDLCFERSGREVIQQN